MAFLPGIFGRGNQQQGTQNQPQNQTHGTPQNTQFPAQGNGAQNNQQQQNQPMNGNGSGGPAGSQNQPANSQMQGAGGNPANPLDPFLQMMTPNQQVQQRYQQQQEQLNQPLFGEQFTPDNIKQHVSKTDFMAGADPQMVQKALGGDHQAFAQVINSAVQNAVATSIQMSQGMVEHGVKMGTERFGSTMDSRIRNFQLKNQNSKNPALSHPIGKALLGTVVQQIAQANPNLSPEDAHAKGEELFAQFAQMMNANQNEGQSQQQSGPKQPDWEAFLNS